MRFFSIEADVCAGYTISTEAFLSAPSFILSVPVSDSITLGFQTMGAYKFFKTNLFLTDMVGFSASFGTDGTTPQLAIGAVTTLFKTLSSNGITNSMRMRVEYLFPVDSADGISDGSVMVSAGVTLGL
jgi:hypothetical protein